jgi:hypothetical protein
MYVDAEGFVVAADQVQVAGGQARGTPAPAMMGLMT